MTEGWLSGEARVSKTRDCKSHTEVQFLHPPLLKEYDHVLDWAEYDAVRKGGGSDKRSARNDAEDMTQPPRVRRSVPAVVSGRTRR